MPSSFDEIVAGAHPNVQDLARQARALITEIKPDATEVPWPNQKIIGYGVGPKKATEHFCYISIHQRHVNVGFNHGSALSDADRLLEGIGVRYRHVKVKDTTDLSNPGLRRLLQEALMERLQTTANA
jgi:hypothetical protein